MKNNLKKTLDDILNKKFSKNFTVGYDPLEVDMFFDNIRSYLVKLYQQQIDLKSKLNDKNQEIESLKNEINKKEESINFLNSEIESYKQDGYQSQRVISEISGIKRDIEKLKNNEKK